MLAAVEVLTWIWRRLCRLGIWVAKMNQRGQINWGCVIDGPLALDNAISEFAVQKGIQSPVAGQG